MSRSGSELLQHILAEADYLSKKVPAEIRERLPDVEWQAMARMRDRLIHGYFGVDYDIVWDVLTNKIPIFCEEIRNALQSVEEHS